MGKSSSPPPAPDPYQTASAQTGSNVNTAIANSILGNANQYSPYGTTTFTQNGNFTDISDGNGGTIRVPQFDQRTILSPEQQGIYDQQTRNQTALGQIAGQSIDRVGSLLGTSINPLSIAPVQSSVRPANLQTSYDAGGPIQRSVSMADAPTKFGQTAGQIQYGIDPTSTAIQTSVGANDFSADRQRVEEAVLARMQPQLDRDRDALSARLASQGITPGSQAYNEAMALQGRQSNDAYTQAILAGGQEQSRLFGMDLQRGQFANQAQAQEFGQNAAAQAANNAAQGQDYNQLLGRGQFAQAGVGMNNASRLSAGQFANAAQGQQNSQNAQQAAFGNAANQQMFSNALQNAALRNSASAQQLQQQIALRNQPLNEINALMSGSQVSNPQVNSYQGGNVANTDITGAVYNSAALQNQQYQQQMQQQNAMMGGLFGLGSTLALGGMTGGLGLGLGGGLGGLFGGARR